MNEDALMLYQTVGVSPMLNKDKAILHQRLLNEQTNYFQILDALFRQQSHYRIPMVLDCAVVT